MNSNKKIVLAIVLVLSVVLIGFGLFSIANSNKSKFIKLVDKYYSSKFSDSDKYIDRKFKLTTDTKVKLEDTDCKFNGDVYYSAERIYIDVLTNLLDDNISRLELYTDYKDLYLKSKILQDQLYKISLGNANVDEINDQTMDAFIKVIKDSIIDNLSESSFSKLKIDSNTMQYTLNIRYNDVYNILSSLLKNLKSNKLTKAYFKDVDINMNDYKDDLDSKEILITYSINANKQNQLVKQTVTMGALRLTLQDNSDSENLISMKLSAKFSGLSILDIDFVQDDYGINFKGNIFDNEILLNSVKNGNKTVYTFKYDDETTLTAEVIEVLADKEYSIDIKSTGLLSITSQSTLKFDVDEPEFNTDGAAELSSDVLNLFE